MLRVRVPTFKDTKTRLGYLRTISLERTIYRAAEAGLQALQRATPVRTGLTASSWYYVVKPGREMYTIHWHNSMSAGDVPLVVLLDVGHGTGTGGYVSGLHFIGPAVKPVFEDMRMDVEKIIHGR